MRIGCLVLLFVALDCPAAAEPRYFIEPLTAEAYVENSGSKSAIAENVLQRIHTVCGNKFTTSEGDATARVHLHIAELKKVSGGSRFLVGPFRGNSNITIDLTVVDAAGQEIKRQRLNRRGNWFLGSVTVGATDNRMLTNIATDVCQQL